MIGYLLFLIGILLHSIIGINSNIIIMYDQFFLDFNGWNCTGGCQLIHKKYSIYSATSNITISNYIQGTDTIINRNRNENDRQLWYYTKHLPCNNTKTFKNPVCVLQFTIMTIVGNFSKTNLNIGVPFIIIDSKNTELLYLPMLEHYQNQICNSLQWAFCQTGIIRFIVPLTRMKYSVNNSIADNNTIKNALINIHTLSILGDWTRGNETVAIDDVQIVC